MTDSRSRNVTLYRNEMPLLFVSFSFRFKVIVKNENILVKSYMNDMIYFLVVAILFVWEIGKPGLLLDWYGSCSSLQGCEQKC